MLDGRCQMQQLSIIPTLIVRIQYPVTIIQYLASGS